MTKSLRTTLVASWVAAGLALPAAALEVAVGISDALATRSRDGRVILILAKRQTPEPRFQVSPGLDGAQIFGVDVDDLGRGGVARFVFTGKGWGHGVGLCQVGAFGMARTGARYEEILAHYYTGITLDHAASAPAAGH